MINTSELHQLQAKRNEIKDKVERWYEKYISKGVGKCQTCKNRKQVIIGYNHYSGNHTYGYSTSYCGIKCRRWRIWPFPAYENYEFAAVNPDNRCKEWEEGRKYLPMDKFQYEVELLKRYVMTLNFDLEPYLIEEAEEAYKKCNIDHPLAYAFWVNGIFK